MYYACYEDGLFQTDMTTQNVIFVGYEVYLGCKMIPKGVL